MNDLLEQRMIVNPFSRQQPPEFLARSQEIKEVEKVEDEDLMKVLECYRMADTADYADISYLIDRLPILLPEKIDTVLTHLLQDEAPTPFEWDTVKEVIICTLIQKSYDAIKLGESVPKYHLNPGDYELRQICGLFGGHDKDNIPIIIHGNVRRISENMVDCDIKVHGDLGRIGAIFRCDLTVFGKIRDYLDLEGANSHEGVDYSGYNTIRTTDSQTFMRMANRYMANNNNHVYLIDENGKTIGEGDE